jgi:beta-lactamase class A
MSTTGSAEELSEVIEEIGGSAGAERVAVAFHDYRSGAEFSHRGDEWFHAASTIKLPVLFGVFAEVDAGAFSLSSRLHVRNRFLGVADERYFRVNIERDAAGEVHTHIGRTLRIGELARHMIVTSSNLATNLLVDLVGIDSLRATMERYEVEGIELRRGVEDEVAYERGINNRVTASGLVNVLRLIEEAALSRDASERMLEILHEQEFRSGIPAGLPDGARVANKTGEISTVAHDAGLVYLPDRHPYVVAILTEWAPGVTSGRRDTLASLSRAVYHHLEVGVDA